MKNINLTKLFIVFIFTLLAIHSESDALENNAIDNNVDWMNSAYRGGIVHDLDESYKVIHKWSLLVKSYTDNIANSLESTVAVIAKNNIVSNECVNGLQYVINGIRQQ